jgi:SnoaL-like protein
MLRRLAPVLAAVSCLALISTWTGARATSSPAPGPGAVIEMHKQLFAALDSGDEVAAKAFLTPGLDTPFFLLSPAASNAAAEEPQRLENAEAAAGAFAALAQASRRAGGVFQTRITSAKADCESPQLSYAVLEIERTHTVQDAVEVRRYRSTSLVQYVDHRWRLAHWHVSAAK